MAAVAAVAVVAVALVLAPEAAGAGGHSAVRTLDRASVAPGRQVEVTIEARDFGRFGRVSEALPAGWTLTGSTLPEELVTVEAGVARFLLLSLDPPEPVVFTYTADGAGGGGDLHLLGVHRRHRPGGRGRRRRQRGRGERRRPVPARLQRRGPVGTLFAAGRGSVMWPPVPTMRIR